MIKQSNTSIWYIDRTLSGATTLGQSGSGSDGHEGVLWNHQSSSTTAASPSDCLMSYPWHSYAVGIFYSSSRLYCVGNDKNQGNTIYIYIYRERERQRQRESERENERERERN